MGSNDMKVVFLTVQLIDAFSYPLTGLSACQYTIAFIDN